ncbi:sulfotransferase family protein [Allochromatium palmeri]|uniref:sulfotransferase family protein n=1 Tax=Allochromatium palmeri TaxID=231048 RepID=UPI001642C600|nr:sulfotransferase [Allochromatium palmeri]
MDKTDTNISTPGSFIFLAGMPRSGTTWIAKIFDSHPDVLYRHEPDSRGRLNAIPLFAQRANAESHNNDFQKFLECVSHLRDEKTCASLPIFPKSYISPSAQLIQGAMIYLAKSSAKVLGRSYVPQLFNTKRHPQIRLTWKSIESLGRIGLIATLAPDSRSLLILRHPCGYVASTLRGETGKQFECLDSAAEDYGLFEPLLAAPSSSKFGLTIDSLKKLDPVERLAWRWVLYYEHAISEVSSLSQVCIVRYEDFCADPIMEARQAFQFTNLNWSLQTERFIASSTAKDVKGYYSLTRNPLSASRRWETEIDRSIQQRIWNIAGDTAPGRYYDF